MEEETLGEGPGWGSGFGLGAPLPAHGGAHHHSSEPCSGVFRRFYHVDMVA